MTLWVGDELVRNAGKAYNRCMPTLTIRDLSDRAYDALRLRAAGHGRSMEAEARVLIEGLVAPEPTPANMEAIRALQAHVIATSREEGRGVVDGFLAERFDEWDEH